MWNGILNGHSERRNAKIPNRKREKQKKAKKDKKYVDTEEKVWYIKVAVCKKKQKLRMISENWAKQRQFEKSGTYEKEKNKRR